MKTTKKTQARHYAFKFLFQFQHEKFDANLEATLNDLDSILEEFDATYVEPDREHPDNIIDSDIKSFAAKLIRGVLGKREELEKTIAPLLTKGEFKSINSVNQLAVLLGSYELLFMPETPAKVVINEAINMAKEYGTKDSHSFVNSILDRISKGE